jgi:hypothetical protein
MRVRAPADAGSLAVFSSKALADGQVNLISLEMLARQLGVMWALRRQHVDRFVERLLTRELTGSALFVKVTDTVYLIGQPDIGRRAGQAACLGLVRQVLDHFLGASTKAAEGVYEVTVVGSGWIEARAIAPADLLAAEAAEKLERRRAADLRRASEPFSVSNGMSVRVTTLLERVIELKTHSEIGWRLGRAVASAKSDEMLAEPQIGGLAGVDILRIDLAAAIQGLAQARALETPPPCLIVPISYACLSSQRGRTEFIELLKDSRDCAQHGVICEIFDVEGAPRATLQEMVASVRPFALFVVARLTPTPPTGIHQLRGVGFRAIAFECPPGQTPGEFIGWAQARTSMARHVVGSVLLYGAPPAADPARLAALGASHTSLRA